MNKMQIEELLFKEGFTSKEISIIRQQVEKSGYSYRWLLSQLKKRFLVALILIVILFSGLVYTINIGTQENLVSYSLTLFTGLTIFIFSFH